MNKGPIDREYAIHQIELAIADANPEEKEQFERFKEFLMVCPSPDDLKMRLPVAKTLETGLKKLILSLEYEDVDMRAAAFDDLAEVCNAGETPFGHPVFLHLKSEVDEARKNGKHEELFASWEAEIRKESA